MRKLIYVILLIILGAFLYFFFISNNTNETIPPEENTVTENEFKDHPIFTQSLASQNITLDGLGYHSFTPNGNYFVFTGINSSDEIPAKTYLLTLETGEVKPLPGILLRGVEDSRIITLFSGNNLILYNLENGQSETIETDGNIFAGALSPGGTKFVFNTLEGVRIYFRGSKTVSEITESQYDGAYVWFSDSKRMLGFKDTGKSAFEAGNKRQFGIWNIDEKTFTPLTKIPETTVRGVTWIVPDKVARVNTGWDDGSHDYIYDLEKDEVVDLGDTSSALFGGMKEDTSLGLFALVLGDTLASNKFTASIYKGAEKLASVNLPPSYTRENIQIVNENTILYLRKHLTTQGNVDRVELVRLNFDTNEEVVLQELPDLIYGVVSLSPDHKTWVVSGKDKFFVGEIE